MALGCRYAIVARMRHQSVDGLGRGHVFKCLGVPARHATRRCGWPEERQPRVSPASASGRQWSCSPMSA